MVAGFAVGADTRSGAAKMMCMAQPAFFALLPSYVLTFALLCILAAGCSGNKRAALTEEEVRQKTYAPRPPRLDEIVIGGETITCDDVMVSPPEEDATGPSLRERLEQRARDVPLDQFITEVRPLIQQRLNRNIVTRIVLSKRARRELGDQSDDALDKMAEKELRRFILEEYGGNGAEADAALQRRGMNRSTYKERRKRDILAQYVIDSKIRRTRPITHGEILAKYNEIKDQEYFQEGVLQLRLIDIEVAKVSLGDVDEDPVQKARQIAEGLRKRIDAGEDFSQLAKQYSNDVWSEQGGLLRPRAPDAFAAPYDVLARQAKDMKQGQVAGPIEVSGHFFVLKVEAKQDRGYKPLEDVQGQVREEILRDRRRSALEDLEAEIAQQAAVADMTQFVDRCLEKIYRQARASAGNQSGTE